MPDTAPPDVERLIQSFTSELQALNRRLASDRDRTRAAAQEFRDEVIEKLAILPRLEKRLDHVEQVLVRGNGRPALTERVRVLEEREEASSSSREKWWGFAAGAGTTIFGAFASWWLAR